MKKLIAFPILIMALFYSGCGFVGLMGTETSYEKKIPAEYDLYRLKGKKILVLIEQPHWLNAQTNLRYYLTKGIGKSLEVKVKIKPDNIISYNELSNYRSKTADFALFTPAKVGKALGADLVLLVMVEDYQLSQLGGMDYYNGFLSVKSTLFDASGDKLWPRETGGKSVKVGFETGENGQESAVERLVSDCAYCITRYFYDCPKNKFKIFDERSDSSWGDWE